MLALSSIYILKLQPGSKIDFEKIFILKKMLTVTREDHKIIGPLDWITLNYNERVE